MMHRQRYSALVWLLALGLFRAETGHAQDDLLLLAIGDATRHTAEIAVTLDAVVETSSGKLIAPSTLGESLDHPRVILVGEEHTAAAYHEIQLHVLKSLHAAAIPLMIGLEMFPYSSQPVLDRWIAGELDQARFVDESDWYSVWGYHWNYYREIFEFARTNRIRLIGLNEDRDTHVSADVSAAAIDDHRALVRAFFEVDSPVHGGISDEQFEQLTQAQARRDAIMAQHATEALDRNPLHTLVVLAGTGHVLYDLGIARQLPTRLRDRAASIVPVPIEGESRAVKASVADVVWGIPATPFPRYPELGVVALASETGLDIIHVDENSPAENADIRVGDRLKALAGTSLRQRSDLSRSMAQFLWGDVVEATVERDGADVVIDVALRR